MSDLLADRLDPSRAALVVIDVQNDFCHPDGRAARGGRDVSAVDLAVTRLSATIAAAREAGVPVVFVRTEHGADLDSLAWRRRFDARLTEPNPVDNVNCATGSWGAEFYGVEPVDGDAVVTKHRYSAFSSPEFRAVVRDLDRPSLLMTGVATEVCVESTMRAAVDSDLLATLVSDCAATYSPEIQSAAVARLAGNVGPAVDSAELMRRWATTG